MLVIWDYISKYIKISQFDLFEYAYAYTYNNKSIMNIQLSNSYYELGRRMRMREVVSK